MPFWSHLSWVILLIDRAMRSILAPLTALLFAGTLAGQSLSFNLQSIGGADPSYIVFTPQSPTSLSITFQPNSANSDFSISGATASDLNGDTGSIVGSFAVSGITTGPTVETGTVTSLASAALVITDAAGDSETAHLWWNTAFTAFSTGGVEYFDMNSGPATNLSHFTYAGTAGSQLQSDFAAITAGDAIINFSFASAPNSLSSLANAPGPTLDSFSGQVSEIPEPASSAALMAALVAVVFWIRSRASLARIEA